MEILLGIIVGIILGAGGAIVAAVAIIRREKSQRMQLAEELLSLRQEKDQLTRSEATTAARLANAEQTLQATKELHEQNAEAQRQVFQTELQLAREGMRAQFEKEMQARTEQLKKANTENMQQVVDPLKRELDLLRELVAKSKESSDKNTASLAQSIRTIIEHDQARDKTTQTLANALKNRGKVQGDWGEQVLPISCTTADCARAKSTSYKTMSRTKRAKTCVPTSSSRAQMVHASSSTARCRSLPIRIMSAPKTTNNAKQPSKPITSPYGSMWKNSQRRTTPSWWSTPCLSCSCLCPTRVVISSP